MSVMAEIHQNMFGCKKAFDSVGHGYIERTLKKYGFGPNFIKFLGPYIVASLQGFWLMVT